MSFLHPFLKGKEKMLKSGGMEPEGVPCMPRGGIRRSKKREIKWINSHFANFYIINI